jgi:hypothetical protein
MTATAKPAHGVFGHILRMDDKYYFRVYNYDKDTFIDYDLYHSDLFVQIKDLDAFFYSTTSGLNTLDHSPETLGK